MYNNKRKTIFKYLKIIQLLNLLEIIVIKELNKNKKLKIILQ